MADRTFLGLSTDDWINLGLSILFVIVGYFVVTLFLGRLFKWLVSKTSMQADDEIWAAIKENAKRLVILLLFRYSVMRLGFFGSGLRTVLDDLFFLAGLALITKIALTLINLAVGEYRTRFEQQEKENDSTHEDRLDPVITALHRLADFFVLITALSIGLVHFGINANATYIVLLVVGVILSFGSKDIITDAISGLIILVDQPFQPGDAILVTDLNTWGDVVKIGTRSTRLRTGDHSEVVVPNSKIVKSEVVNYTMPESNYRVQTDLGIAYTAHMDEVRQVISTTVRSVDGVMAEEPVDVLFQSFDDSSRAVRVRWWIASFHQQQRMLDKVNAALDVALAQAHIELPYRTYALQVKLDDEHDEHRGSQPRPSAKS